MRRFKAFRLMVVGLILVVSSFVIYEAFGATGGTCTKVMSEGRYEIWQYVITYANKSDNETFTLPTTGVLERVVVDANTTDADGDFYMEDISDANFIQWTNPLASSKELSYVVTSTDISSNTYGGVPIAGTSTGYLTSMAGAMPMTITFYVRVR